MRVFVRTHTSAQAPPTPRQGPPSRPSPKGAQVCTHAVRVLFLVVCTFYFHSIHTLFTEKAAARSKPALLFCRGYNQVVRAGARVRPYMTDEQCEQKTDEQCEQKTDEQCEQNDEEKQTHKQLLFPPE